MKKFIGSCLLVGLLVGSCFCSYQKTTTRAEEIVSSEFSVEQYTQSD